MNGNGRPVAQQDRALVLDILRGFALLGILLANSAIFSLYLYQPPELQQAMPTAAPDRVLDWFDKVFITGKFYSIFSLLFGIGFSIILTNNKNRNTNGLYFFYRRLFILLLFGLAHSLLLWDGDILFFYAIVGAVLPLFRNLKDKQLIFLAISLLVMPLILDIVKVATGGKYALSIFFLKLGQQMDKPLQINSMYPGNWLIEHDSYRDLLGWSKAGFWYGLQYRIDSHRILKVLAMFIVGLYVGRNHWHQKLSELAPILRRIQLAGFAVGIPAGIAMAWFSHDSASIPDVNGLADTAAYMLNVVPLALAYASTVALWVAKGGNTKALHSLAPVGRMALTNYIMQSVLGILIYYGIGLGLGGRYGASFYMPVALVIYIFQVLYSNWWFRHFNYGPLEWLWRTLTYGKRLPLMRKIQPG